MNDALQLMRSAESSGYPFFKLRSDRHHPITYREPPAHTLRELIPTWCSAEGCHKEPVHDGRGRCAVHWKEEWEE